MGMAIGKSSLTLGKAELYLNDRLVCYARENNGVNSVLRTPRILDACEKSKRQRRQCAESIGIAPLPVARAGAYRAMITKRKKRRKCNINRPVFVGGLGSGRSLGIDLSQGLVSQVRTKTCGRTTGTARNTALSFLSVQKHYPAHH